MFRSGVQGRRGQTEVRRKVVEFIRSLNRQAAKLTISLNRLKAFEDECFNKTVWHLKIGDRASASIYASEVAYLRRLQCEIKGVKDLVTQTSLRLDSLLNSQHLTASLTTLIETLRQIPYGLDAEDLGQLTKALCDAATSQEGVERSSPQKTDLQSEDVLREAESSLHREYSEPLTG